MDREAYFAWLTREQGLAAGSATIYTRIAARIAKSRFRRNPNGWLQNVIDPGTPPGTAASYRSAARHFQQWLEQHEPGTTVAVPKLPKMQRHQGHLRAPLDDAQLEVYYQAVDAADLPPQVRCVLRLLPRTGLRISEACAIEKTHMGRKGGKYGVELVGKGNKVRWVPLNRSARDAVREYLLEKLPQSPWLFQSARDPKRPLRPGQVREALRQLRESLPRWAKNLTPHVLRHTFATRALERGADVATLQSLLGHANMDTTGKYLNPHAGTLANAVERLED